MESSPFNFYSRYIKISDKGIDLTRDMLPYKHISYSEIEDITIRDGYLIKNRVPIRIVSILAIALSFIFLTFYSFLSFNSNINNNYYFPSLSLYSLIIYIRNTLYN